MTWCRQNAPNGTDLHLYFQNFPGGNTPRPPKLGRSKPSKQIYPSRRAPTVPIFHRFRVRWLQITAPLRNFLKGVSEWVSSFLTALKGGYSKVYNINIPFYISSGKTKQDLHTCEFHWLCFVSSPFWDPRLPCAAGASVPRRSSHSSSTTESAETYSTKIIFKHSPGPWKIRHQKLRGLLGVIEHRISVTLWTQCKD